MLELPAAFCIEAGVFILSVFSVLGIVQPMITRTAE